MIIAGIDIPELLIEAQEAGSLVIFAGAGVSKLPPSRLPDFAQLTRQIAVLHRLKREHGEPLDHYLGRLEEDKLDVHKRAEDIINKRSKRPNRLHINIINLFPNPEYIRIITTNFDSLLTKSVLEIMPDYAIREYYAPALPVGYEFNGIVYLHGRIDGEKSSLILTDRDFGRAYLTDGWARRFLLQMFDQFSVLFIGYSHRDRVMQYLARGLPAVSISQRFAFTLEGNDAYWQNLGITPIPYPRGRPWKKHEKLEKVISAWAHQTSLGETGLAQRVRRIAENPNEIDGKLTLNDEDRDLVIRFLSHERRIIHFTPYATSPVWLQWADSEELFTSVFSVTLKSDAFVSEQSIRYLSSWIAGFMAKHGQEVLSLIELHHLEMHPVLFNEFVKDLAYNDRYATEDYEIWVPILLAASSDKRHLGELVNSFVHGRGDRQLGKAAIVLFGHLTQPQLIPKKSMRLFEEESEKDRVIDYEVTIAEGYDVDRDTLVKFWNLFLQPHLDEYIDELEPLATSRLHCAHSLLALVSNVNEDWDRHSMHRSAIEQHDQDKYGTDMDPLINAARDMIEYLADGNPDRARFMIDTWIGSGVPLFRRLAIHGMRYL